MNLREYDFKGIPYIVYKDMWDSCSFAKLFEKDFDILKDYVLKLEDALYNATGLTAEETIKKNYEGDE